MPIAPLDDVNIYYDVRGDGPLAYVFCHGLGGSAEGFEREDCHLSWSARSAVRGE